MDEGYDFCIRGELRTFRGSVAFCSGDNLGSQLLGGYKQGSQSYRKCRECMGNSEELEAHFHEDFFVLRTKDSYNEQCERLDWGEHFRKTYGLNKPSILNKSRFFHVVGGLPADAMHDVLEGVLQYGVKESIKVYINEQKLFTLDELNKRIAECDYGYHNDANRPAQITQKKLASADNGLRQHANQMWCRGLHLPLIVGNLVPEDDEHWQHYCTLLQIVRIIFSPVINREQIPYLQVLIQEFLEKFKDLYPQCSIIPKMHYMVHMPRTMLQ
ncbi:uncharacterized protein LOC122957349 [Acropora millepora]|uniref:uncharacterized protein LOC122957349 n=1 Tax=Acropora millepora TaxID=45264 RepID=UPI001CF30CF3|nr:uncharacterized protein LOC122957349 [Acropora millepora]